METKADAIVGKDGLLYRRDGTLISSLVHTFRTAEVSFAAVDLILLRLCSSGDEGAPAGTEVPPQNIHQLRMTAETARRLAAELQHCADRIEGTHQALQ
ncbi:MAG: hypothetical protein VR71_02055 [Roseovarius sp. BRH_c41]|uniref:hypothetical protein n=1 Tax=Roseovarius sp. BRH_c41 TaxID=1629709 RepID=UPI0005F108A2|nr:hypothetical protein [Roseovarius sp. BRH_c41]KJS45220.1 MAG: hypothetical protein VR71_02055 [Roseovarius sp. BRH_c41]